jgi:hypothetical protein
MKLRRVLLRTTMLSGLVGGLLLTALEPRAADLSATTPFANFAPAPAVDGVNAKVDGLGGSLGHRSLYGSDGALSIPLGGQYGTQIDGLLASWGGRTVGGVAPHLFWRNPAQGLLGVYTSHTWWDQFGGIYVGRVAGEGEWYSGPLTLQGIAGSEFGNSRTNAIITPAGTLFQTFDVKTQFFDEVNLKYYMSNNWDAYVGHRYLGGKNMLALGTEVAVPLALGRGTLATGFVEGRVGTTNSEGVWGGLRLYFGQKDKSLIDRHRQDDPPKWSLSPLQTINNSFKQSFDPAPPTTPTSTSSSSCI